ncbi:hypothetical protein FA95DRAFT_1587260 [Auriscalpium vulgare]|uniref:Uncharacterized protein n=1 Tax=Auriscalpium vulgare TaxID=40419 RepID=A0ACB8S495_9AGAM|nr:hypothetical protein FA95DRAFT_1587260 [Auriscalpium vulgare]
MQNPAEDIEKVVQLLTTSASPDIQKAAVQKYFTSDAAFHHPVVTVASAPASRESILGIFQWYRIISPHIDLTVNSVSYDEAQSTVYLDITQKFHMRLSPFGPAPARLITLLRLRQEGGLHYIELQEDFYHPDQFLALLLPPLTLPIRLAMRAGAVVSNLAARTTQVALGVWLPRSGVLQEAQS